MKMIKRVMTGICMACISAVMYDCFVNGAPHQEPDRIIYMILTGIFCISVGAGTAGILWYVKWLHKKNLELKNMLETLLKNTDKLDK